MSVFIYDCLDNRLTDCCGRIERADFLGNRINFLRGWNQIVNAFWTVTLNNASDYRANGLHIGLYRMD